MYSRTIYVNVDSPNLGFPYFNFLGEAQYKKTPCILSIALVNEIHQWMWVMVHIIGHCHPHINNNATGKERESKWPKVWRPWAHFKSFAITKWVCKTRCQHWSEAKLSKNILSRCRHEIGLQESSTTNATGKQSEAKWPKCYGFTHPEVVNA